MRVVDAHTGRDLKVGDALVVEGVPYRVLEITPGIFKASMLVATPRDRTLRVPLTVRWMHPAFRFQHVAFVPT